MNSAVLSFLLSIAFCWTLLFVLIPFLRNRLPDRPNSRSSHVAITPRGGGLSFVVVTCGSSLLAVVSGSISAFSILPLSALPLSIVGLLDDRFGLPSSLRYIFQFFTAILILALSPSLPILSFLIYPRGFIDFFVGISLLITFTAIINFVNFMDGLDGLVAGCMVIVISSIIFKASGAGPLWCLTGSLLGFLSWNWSPAKIFMGDVGSMFLGAVYAGLVFYASSWNEMLAFLLVSTPLIGDAFFCVFRRFVAGQRVLQAHRLHLFQRLHQAGWPHARVSSLYIVATALIAIAFQWGGLPSVITVSALELLIGVWLDQRVAVPFAVASRN